MGFLSITRSGASLPIFAIFAIFGCAKGLESPAPGGADDADAVGTAGDTAAGANALGGFPDSGAGAPSSAAGGNTAAGAIGSSAGIGGSTSTGGTSSSAGAGTSGGGKAGGSAQGGRAGATGSGGLGAQLFSDDFEDGNADGWSVSGGTWAVLKDGSQVYAQLAAGTGSNVLISANGGAAWTDQVLSAVNASAEFDDVKVTLP